MTHLCLSTSLISNHNMDYETYKALNELMDHLEERFWDDDSELPGQASYRKVADWMDEVAKQYVE